MSSKKLYEKTREQSIADFEAQTKDLQREHPDVDFKAVVIEPTMNLMFDIKENLSEDERKKHEESIALMLRYTGKPAKAERYLWQARDYLKPYPDVLKQFDDIYINQRPVPVMLSQLHEALSQASQPPQQTQQTDSDYL